MLRRQTLPSGLSLRTDFARTNPTGDQPMNRHRRSATLLIFAAALAFAASWADHGRADAPPGHYTVSNGNVYDTKTKLTWQQTISTSSFTWADAQTYCANLNLNGTNWRVPSAGELQTLLDETQVVPSIDTTAFPGTPSDRFWTSTRWAASASYAWTVDFHAGRTRWSNTTYAYRVRCVR